MSTATVVWDGPVATDNSQLAPIVTCDMENGSKFEIGKNEVVCQALDEAGNLAICSFYVDVKGACTMILK